MDFQATNFKNVLYRVNNQVAHITLNRPERMNALNEALTMELFLSVTQANDDKNVKVNKVVFINWYKKFFKVILLSGSGGAFCAGYDLKQYAEAERGSKPGSQKMPWDPYEDFHFMSRCNEVWMSLWKSLKPVICKINGVAIGGGSDIALCCDVTFMADNAVIGYPPSRVWGCPTTAMWYYRVGIERAKRILFTGELLSGKDAEKIGLIGQSVAEADLDQEVDRFIDRIITVPTNQLFFQKQVVNHAVEQAGLLGTQRLATLFDGMSRHTPEGVVFQKRVQEVGFKKAVQERDSGAMSEWFKDGSKLWIYDKKNFNAAIWKKNRKYNVYHSSPITSQFTGK